MRSYDSAARAILSCVLTCVVLALPARGDDLNPLKPIDTKSPADTLREFRENVRALYKSVKEEGFGDAARRRREIFAERAVRCLDRSRIAPNVREEIGRERAVQLAEILDRIPLPSETDAPDDDPPDADQLKLDAFKDTVSWQVPNSEITIVKIVGGPRDGEWLFSAETVERLPTFFEQARHLPYKEGTILENAYQLYLLGPGPLIPAEWIIALPRWTKRTLLGQAVWKWIATLLVLALLLVALALLYRFGSRKTKQAPRASFWRRIALPLIGCALAYGASVFITEQINLRGAAMHSIVVALTLLAYVLASLLVFLVNRGIAEYLISTPRISAKSLDAHVVRSIFRILSIAGVIGLLFACTNQLGVPLTPVLAGLGIGGIAVALAAQNSLENLLGGITLFLDRPIRIGDFCRVGDRIGIIEEIGLRSTRLRTLDDTVVTIPNATLAKQEVENYALRRKIWYHPRIQLHQGTSPDQIRYVLVEIRRMLYSHPRVDPSPARIRFVGFGDYSLDLDVFAYVTATDYGEFLEIAEDLNLRVQDVIAEAGTALAAPVRRVLNDELNKLDATRASEVEKRVNDWRERDELYLPSFPTSVVENLRGTLDFPPKGAPDLRGQSYAEKQMQAADVLPPEESDGDADEAQK